MNDVDFYLEDLLSKFLKINPDEYYLSYSGGADSHLLFWFLKTYLKEKHPKEYEIFLNIKVVGINTRNEFPEILKRIHANCDIVLRPKLFPHEIIERYGMPCFSKDQDQYINRYQKGSRCKTINQAIFGKKFIGKDNKMHRSPFQINNKARDLLLSGKLHNVSDLCCYYMKKLPAKEYGKKTKTKPILGVMGDESLRRKRVYNSCFRKNGTFTPLYDLTEDLKMRIYDQYKIELPKIYDYINQTGCIGCPYGIYKGGTQLELELVSKARYEYCWKCFGKSYLVRGLKKQRQLKLF